MDGEGASRAYRAFCRWRASLGVPLVVVLGPVGWLAGQGRPERAPSPVRAPIAGEKTGRALLVVSGAGGWLRSAARCWLSALPVVVPPAKEAGPREAGPCLAGLPWRGVAEGGRRDCGGLRREEGGAAVCWTGRATTSAADGPGGRCKALALDQVAVSGRHHGGQRREPTHPARASATPLSQTPAATRLPGFLPAMGARTGDGARSGRP